MFWQIYNELCEQKGLSANAVAKELSIASGTVSEWKKGRIPLNSTLKKISNYFNVSIDYLLGKEKSSFDISNDANPLDDIPPHLEEIMDLCKQMDEKTLEKAYNWLQLLNLQSEDEKKK